MHVIAAKAVALYEVLQPEFVAYQTQIVKNAAALAGKLLNEGVRLVSGGTDNHLMLADVACCGRTGREVQELLDAANITANKNTIPYDKLSVKETSGVRLGTPATTTRGMKEQQMEEIGGIIARLIREGENAVPAAKEQVVALCEHLRKHLTECYFFHYSYLLTSILLTPYSHTPHTSRHRRGVLTAKWR